jgi:hypothetical protein
MTKKCLNKLLVLPLTLSDKKSLASINLITINDTLILGLGVKNIMGSLINDDGKESMESVFDDIHDTFARDIKFIKDAQRVILSTDPYYNYLYKNVRGSVTSITRKIVEATFKARILYMGRQNDEAFDGEAGAQIKVEKHVGEVRIKVGPDGYSYLKETKRCEFDGRKFSVISDEMPHGLFSPRYYTFYLKAVDEG